MTKLLSKIIGGILGVTLATSAGVGIAFSMDNEYKEAKAESTVVEWSRTGTTDNLTSGYTMYTAAEGKTGYYQDGSGTLRYVGAKKTSGAMWTTEPSSIYLTAVIGGGSAKTLDNPVEVSLLDSSFNVISSTTTTITNKITTTSGDSYRISIPTVSSAYGIRISHQKQSQYNVRYYSFSLAINAAATVNLTDELTRATTGVTGTSYANWSNKKLTSPAIYAGNSAGGNTSIQLRNSDNSGIITTTSGGNLKKVVVTFNTATANNRTIYVYGNTAAYTATSELYSNDTDGDTLGSYKYTTGGSVTYTLNVSGSYQYVGFRVTGGAAYITSIAITWESTQEDKNITALTVTTAPTKDYYGVGEKLSLEGLVVTASYSNAPDEVTSNFTTSIDAGYQFTTNDINSNYRVTITSVLDSSVPTYFEVQVVVAYPVKLEFKSYPRYVEGMKLNEGTARLTATYTDESTISDIQIGNAKTVSKIDNQVIDVANTVVDSYNGQNITVEYTDGGITVSRYARIDVVAPLEVNNFYDVPDYILINSTSGTINTRFTSFEGAPTVTVTSSQPSKLTVNFNSAQVTYNSSTKYGYAPFTVTASANEGQYNVIVSISYGEETVSKSVSIIVRANEPGHDTTDGEYIKVTSLSDVTTGRYVIAANVSGTYYSVNAFDNGKMTSQTVTVSNSKITSSAFTVFDITKSGNNYTIQNGSNYIGYDSSTNLKYNSNSYNWSIASGTNGSFSIIPSTANTRGLIFRSADTSTNYYCFKAYMLSNLTKTVGDQTVNSTEYFDIELFKYNGSESSFDLVKEFVDNYMHMNDVSVSNTNDTGACLGSGGYYLTAKAAWNAMVTGYTGSDDLVDVFETKFSDAYARYMAWASRNGDTQPFTGTSIVSLNRNSVVNTNTESTMTLIVVLVALCMTSLLGAYILKKKRAK